MENNMYSAPVDMANQNSTLTDEITQHLAPKPLIHCYSFDLNNQSHIINGIPVLAGEQGEPTSDIHVDGCFINPASVADSNSFVTSQGKTIAGDASNPINNNGFQEHLTGARALLPIASASLAARIGLQENLESSAALPHSMCSLEALGPYIFHNWQDTSNPLPATFGDHAYDEVPGISKWNVDKFLKGPEADGTEILAYSSIGNLIQNGWTSSNVANLTNFAYNSSNCSNELSLSLARSSTTARCSEMSCSNASRSMNGTRSGLEQPSCRRKELSMSLSSDKHSQFSTAIFGSSYLAGIQEILAQIATYSFENVEQINYSAAGVREGGALITPKRRVAMNQNANSMFESHVVESPLERHATESNKSQLLMLLQLVDNRFSQCLDEIHTVVSAFHAATELHPHMHARFALQSISLLYKDLRERISNYILAMGPDFNSLCSEEEKDWCVETSFIQKQLALQQLKRKDQLWRPQRGLPERSVSVLRAWMFQNFLHPYPKDAEKHLLAVKSGLSRSQVSNWFINARVRLWKPMIEEMYAEMNRRKACRNEEGMESTHRSRISMNNQMLNIN